MTYLHFILSNETSTYEHKIGFLGYLQSCRNLGHVLFFVLQDSVGTIQAIWQNVVLDTKLTENLIGKKFYIIGKVRLREKKSSSPSEINNIVEIDVENCFIFDTLMQSYSIQTDRAKIFSLLTEKSMTAFISKNSLFEYKNYSFNLSTQLRLLLHKNGFQEVLKNDLLFKKKKNNKASNFFLSEHSLIRLFWFDIVNCSTPKPLFKLGLSFPSLSKEESLLIGNEIFHLMLKLDKQDISREIPVITEEECLQQYCSLQPNFNYKPLFLRLSDISCLDETTQCRFFQFLQGISVPGISNTPFLVEKIVQYVREETGLSVSYMIIDDHFIDNPLENFIVKKEKLNNTVLFFSPHKKTQYSLKALNAIYNFICKQQLICPYKNEAKWIFHCNHKKYANSHFSLVFKGEKYASCSISDIGPSLHLVKMAFQLTSSHQNQIQKKDKLEQAFKESPFQPFSWISPSHLGAALEAEIIESEACERLEVEAMLGNHSTSGSSSWEKIRSMANNLRSFAMNESDAFLLLNLFPEKMGRTLENPPFEIFQFLWSLLGNKQIIEIFNRKKTMSILKKICSLGIIAEYKQLLFLDITTLHLIEKILESQPQNLNIAKIIKTLINSFPNDFSNLIECLQESNKSGQFTIDEKLISFLLRASKLRLSTPSFFNFFIANDKNANLINDFSSIIKSFARFIFPNKQVNASEILNQFSKKLKACQIAFEMNDDTFYEIIYYLFKPLNTSFSSFKMQYEQVDDQSSFFKSQGVSFEGKNWDFIEKSYFFSYNQNFLRIYPSKNTPSFFAKASAGICTAIDLTLFQRDDHFHLNLVDTKDQRIVGNVQAYLLCNNQKRTMLIRGLNPSISYLNSSNLKFVLDCIFDTAKQIAEHSNIDQLLLCPSLGIWHVESSRKEIIGLLRILTKSLPAVALESPLLLFHFANQDKYIQFGHLLWERKKKYSQSKIKSLSQVFTALGANQ